MFATANDLERRYRNISMADIVTCAKRYLEDINATGEHAKTQNGIWKFDEEAIRKLDGYIGYVPEPSKEEAEAKPAVEKKDPVKELSAENQRLVNEIHQLQDSVTTAEQKNDELSKEIKTLQSSLLRLQDGREAASSQLIRRNEQRAARAEAKSENLKKKLDELTKAKDEQAAELQSRIEELQSKLVATTKSLEEKVKNDFMVLEAQQSENRLYKELADSKQKITDISANVEDERALKEDAWNEIKELKGVLANASHQLESIISQLNAAQEGTSSEAHEEASGEPLVPTVTAVETKPDPKEALVPKSFRTQKKSKKQELDEKRQREADEVEIARRQMDAREQLLEELRQKQQAEKQEEEKKEHTSIFRRIASFF